MVIIGAELPKLSQK